MSNSKVIAVFSGAVILGALSAIFLFTAGLPPRVDTRIHQEIGRALAQEALKLLGPAGKLTVVTRDTGAFQQPAADIALASFAKEARRGGAAAPTVLALQEDPLRPVQVPPGDFFELIRRGGDGDVIVSFMGPPLLAEEQRASLGEIKPRIVAFCPGNLPGYLNLRLLAEQNLLHAAVLSRPLKPGNSAAPAPIPETFENLYVRADAAGLSRLPLVASQP